MNNIRNLASVLGVVCVAFLARPVRAQSARAPESAKAQAQIKTSLGRANAAESSGGTAVGADTVDAHFGYSIAISGGTVVVGAPYASVGSRNLQGVVYVFVEPEGGWVGAADVEPAATLTASDGASGDQFGKSVAISGNTIVVGATNAQIGGNREQGAAYVFVMPPGGWTTMTQTGKLTSAVGKADDLFGGSVAVNGNLAVAGAVGAHSFRGAAYVFVEPATGWANMTQTATLGATDGKAQDDLGSGVAVSGNTVVAGAPYARAGSASQDGAVYVFVEPAGGWTTMMQTAKLTAPSFCSTYCQTGYSVAVDGATVVAGAPFWSGRGAAFVFVEPARGWKNMASTAELIAPDNAEANELGASVSVSGNTVLAGDPFARIDSKEYAGAAYVYVKSAQGWHSMTPTATLTESNVARSAGLGYAVGIDGNNAVAGAPANGSMTLPGSAFVFVEPGQGWQNATETTTLDQ